MLRMMVIYGVSKALLLYTRFFVTPVLAESLTDDKVEVGGGRCVCLRERDRERGGREKERKRKRERKNYSRHFIQINTLK